MTKDEEVVCLYCAFGGRKLSEFERFVLRECMQLQLKVRHLVSCPGLRNTRAVIFDYILLFIFAYFLANL